MRAPELHSHLRRCGSPWLLIATAVVQQTVFVHWLFLRDGAELVAGSPGLRRAMNLPESASSIRLLSIACIFGGAAGLVTMVIVATNTPR